MNSQPLIYAYTRAQAIADGVQVEVTKTAQEAGIKFPLFLTRAVFDAFVTVPPGVTGQDEAGRLWDIVWMTRFAILRHSTLNPQHSTARLPVALYVRNDNRRPRLIKLIAQCGPLDIDDPQPAITVMLPDEDCPHMPRVPASAARTAAPITMNIFSARKYPSQRNGQLSLEQTETRCLAYAIKTIASPSADFNTAAREMAALITGPCWLVPIPDSTGNTDANTRLASLIASYCPGGQVAKAIIRTQPIQSQCERHKLALGPIPLEQHHFARTRKALTLRQTYFVDNVTTSGHTLEAARDALGFGAGLVFADAAPRRVQIQATLL